MERGRVFFCITLLSRSPCLPFFPANHKKNEKQKQKNFFHMMGLDLGQLTRKFYVFKFSRCFLFSMIAQGAWQRAYVDEKTRKKISLAVSDSPRSRKVHGKEHTQSGKAIVRDQNSRDLIIKLIKYQRFKKNKSVTITLYLQICRNGCFWNKRKQFLMK